MVGRGDPRLALRARQAVGMHGDEAQHHRLPDVVPVEVGGPQEVLPAQHPRLPCALVGMMRPRHHDADGAPLGAPGDPKRKDPKGHAHGLPFPTPLHEARADGVGGAPRARGHRVVLPIPPQTRFRPRHVFTPQGLP